jgi:cold shock CspA family protein
MSGEYRGKVVQWNDEGAWGFIKSSDPKVGRVFVHKKYLRNATTLEVGDRVTFRVVSDLTRPGRTMATDVVLLPPE